MSDNGKYLDNVLAETIVSKRLRRQLASTATVSLVTVGRWWILQTEKLDPSLDLRLCILIFRGDTTLQTDFWLSDLIV